LTLIKIQKNKKKYKRNRGRKRKRTTDNDHETDNEQWGQLESANKRLKLIDLKEYHCCVCSELPNDKVFQCPNGCVICSTCYPQLIPCHCPLCRVHMNRHQPIRCRMAEKTLSLRMVTCRYEGCGKSVMFSNLKDHEANECDYKPIECKFHLLGCHWKGVRRDLTRHEAKCGKTININECLRIVEKFSKNLGIYKRFCKECHSICSESVHVSTSHEFEVNAVEELMLCGYDFVVALRSKKKTGSRRTKDLYEIAVKLCFDEDPTVLTGDTEEVNIGVIVDPKGDASYHLVMELKCQISGDKLDSGWIVFEKQMDREQYKEAFRGGFSIKIFDFSDG